MTFLFISCIVVHSQELSDLNRLTGSWKLVKSGSLSFEEWSFNGTEYVGSSYLLKDSGSDVTENLVVKKVGNYILYIAVPVNQLPAMFTLTEHSYDWFIFENREHDFPQKITYNFIGSDSLFVTIEGSVDGKNKRIHFPFQKQ